MTTYKQKFNIKYKQPRDTSNSLSKIAKLSGYKRTGLQTIVKKGMGAYKSNPKSVRPNVKSSKQWGIARVYSAVMGGKARKIDKKHLIKSNN